MGYFGWPVYGENLGNVIETANNLIVKIRTNKFDKQDLVELAKVLEEIKTAAEKYEG